MKLVEEFTTIGSNFSGNPDFTGIVISLGRCVSYLENGIFHNPYGYSFICCDGGDFDIEGYPITIIDVENDMVSIISDLREKYGKE